MSIVVNKTRLPVTQWQTESGSVVSISDARKRYAKSLSVALEPIQDLHGYSYPWIGGAGKNLFNKDDNNSIVAGYIASSAFSTSNPKACTVYVPISPSTAYTVSKKAGFRFQVATSPNAPAHGVAFTNKQNKPSGTSITITSGASDAYLWAWVYLEDTDTGTLDEMLATVQIEAGSTPSSYEPYENICPISGHTAVTVTRCGKNLIDDSKTYVANATTVYVGAESNAYTVALPAGTYTISVDFSGEKYGMYYREKNDGANRTLWDSGNASLTEKTFTIEESGTFRFWAYRGTASGGVDPTKIIHVQIELGTATAYEAYNGNTYAIQLGQTVYGGSVDLVSGVMTVTNVYKALAVNDMNNSESYPGWKGFGMRDIFGAGYQAYTSYLCDSFSGKSVGINTNGSNDIVYLPKEQWGVTNQTEFKQVYGGYVFGFVFPLATPQTIQLSQNQIEMLMRNNTVWSDAGQVTLEYARIHQ